MSRSALGIVCSFLFLLCATGAVQAAEPATAGKTVTAKKHTHKKRVASFHLFYLPTFAKAPLPAAFYLYPPLLSVKPPALPA